MWTLSGTGKAGKAWMAWPAAGTIPLQAIAGARGQTVDATGWTVQSDSINLAGAQVTVMVDGAAQPVTVTQLGNNYGSKYAIRFNPMGWTTPRARRTPSPFRASRRRSATRFRSSTVPDPS